MSQVEAPRIPSLDNIENGVNLLRLDQVFHNDHLIDYTDGLFRSIQSNGGLGFQRLAGKTPARMMFRVHQSVVNNNPETAAIFPVLMPFTAHSSLIEKKTLDSQLRNSVAESLFDD